MGRARNPNPSYLRHRSSGKARVVVYDQGGQRRQIMLPGRFNSKESLEEYHRICAILRNSHGRLPVKNSTSTLDLSITEFVLRYMNEHASVYYVDPVTRAPTSEIVCLRQAFRPLNRLFGNIPTFEFDSLKLESLQIAMATDSWLNARERNQKAKNKQAVGIARSTINRHIDRIKRFFRWGCAKKIVPADNLVNLEAVAGLKQGRSVAKESKPVTPVEIDIVERTITHLPPVTADIVRVLLLTGARVGELCRLCGLELDRSGPIWLYQVRRHKTLHHGHTRNIAFGPQAQLILRRYLKADPDAILFSPADQDRLIKEKKRARRKTPVQPSQRDRSKKNPKRKLSETFTPQAVNHAIRRACIKAGVKIWHTHQLRNTASLLIMREHGIEAARSVLGHKTTAVNIFHARFVRRAARAFFSRAASRTRKADL